MEPTLHLQAMEGLPGAAQLTAVNPLVTLQKEALARMQPGTDPLSLQAQLAAPCPTKHCATSYK